MTLALVALAACAGPDLPAAPPTLGAPPAVASDSGPAPSSGARSAAETLARLHPSQAVAELALAGRGLHPAAFGTGFFVAGDGQLLTNNHVAARCEGLTVEVAGGAVAATELLAADAGADLALLRAATPPPAVAVFDADWALDGRAVAVIGFPEQGLPRIEPFSVPGRLTGPLVGDLRRYAFQADLRHGNSGSPVFGESGLVEGVVFAKIDTVETRRHTGKLVLDRGFAITNDSVALFLAAHGVDPARASGGPPLADLSARVRPSVVRVVCWRPR